MKHESEKRLEQVISPGEGAGQSEQETYRMGRSRRDTFAQKSSLLSGEGLPSLHGIQCLDEATKYRQCVHGPVIFPFLEIRAALGHGIRHMSQAQDFATGCLGECIESGGL